MAFRDPERKKEYDRQHKEENKEYYQRYFQDYQLDNAEHIKTYNRWYVETHKEERWEKKLIRVFGPDAVSKYYSLLSSFFTEWLLCYLPHQFSRALRTFPNRS